MFLFLSARWILWIHSDSGNFCFQGFLFFLVPHCDICTRFPNWFDVITNWFFVSVQSFSLALRAQCSCHPLSIVHIVGLCRFHFSIQVEIENVVFEIYWNEFVLSMPILQFLKMNPHSLTNVAVNGKHVSTVMSEVEILSSFAHDFCSTAQNFVYTSESSIQRSEQSVFIVSPELQRSTIRNPFTTGSPIESSISCSFWTKAQWECVHCSSCVQLQLHPFKPLRTTGGTDIQTSKRKCAFGSVIRLFPTLVPPNRTPFIKTPALVPFVTIPTIVPEGVSGTDMSRLLSF